MIDQDDYPLTVYGAVQFTGFKEGLATFQYYPNKEVVEAIPLSFTHAEEAIEGSQLEKDPRILEELANWRKSNTFAFFRTEEDGRVPGLGRYRPPAAAVGNWLIYARCAPSCFEDENWLRIYVLSEDEFETLLARPDTRKQFTSL